VMEKIETVLENVSLCPIFGSICLVLTNGLIIGNEGISITLTEEKITPLCNLSHIKV
jgi:hypothetical protein